MANNCCSCQEFSNPAELLHPIELWVEINVDGRWMKGIRNQIIERKKNDRVYLLEDGNMVTGKFRWRYL